MVLGGIAVVTADIAVGLTDNVRMAIRHIMKVRGKEQRDIAAILGISQASVSRKLNYGPKASGITLDDLEAIAQGLGVDIRVSFSDYSECQVKREKGDENGS